MIYRHFLEQHITLYNGQIYCDRCKITFQNFKEGTRHYEEDHSSVSSKISDFLNKMKLSKKNCTKLVQQGIIIRGIQQDYFCIYCQTSISSLHNFSQHLKEENHCKYIGSKSNAKKPLLENPADKLNNNTINDQTISVDVQNESDLIKNLPSSFKAEEKSTILLKSYNEDSISEGLQSENYIDMAFCCLCSMFIYKTTIKNHMISKNHKSAVSIFREIRISNQQMLCIIKLEKERKTLRSLQLNNKKFNGTIWPEHAETLAKYTCDQCNKMVEQDDIINHEITIHKSSMMFSMKFIYNWSSERRDLNVTICYPLFKCSFCNEIIHGIVSLQAHFSKCEHKENIKSLIDIKRQEFDNCKNIEIYLEPIEFLSLISFKNNGGTIQILEQPVMYIKNNYQTLHKYPRKIQNTFTYICFDCNYTAYKINDVINHLCEMLRHLKHFENILLTYMSIYSVSTSRELIVNKNEREVKSPVSKEDVSIDNESLTECSIDKIQVNTGQYSNHNLIVEKNSSNTNSRMSQNEENNSGFFISLDIFSEMNTLIKIDYELNWLSTNQLNKSALNRYNKIYLKDYLDMEEIMFACNERKLMKIKSNLQFFIPSPDTEDKILCLICESLQLFNIQAIYEHINSEGHIIKFNMLHENEEHLELLKELVKIQPAYTKCFACKIHTFENRKINIDFKSHICTSLHKNNCNQLRDQVEIILKEFQNLWYNIQYFACIDCNEKFRMKIRFMDHLNHKHREIMRKMTNSRFEFCLTCATLWYETNDTEDIHINYRKHCQLQMHQYLKKSNDFALTPLPQPLQELLRDVNEISANLFKSSKKVLNDPKVTQLMDALKHIFGTSQLPVEVLMFGSRVTGLASTNSDIDIYLDFGKYIYF